MICICRDLDPILVIVSPFRRPTSNKTPESKPSVHISQITRIARNEVKPNRYQPPGFFPNPLPSILQQKQEEKKTHLRRRVRKYSLQTPPAQTRQILSTFLLFFARFSFLPFLLHNSYQQRGGGGGAGGLTHGWHCWKFSLFISFCPSHLLK